MGIPVIDIFAGPGGLAEGFSSFRDANNHRIFDIKLSIEKDEQAYKTLQLRSFCRQFRNGEFPDLFYEYVKENNPKKQIEILEKIKVKYPAQWKNAEKESWLFELPYPEEFDKNGNRKGGYSKEEINERNNQIDKHIREAIPKGMDFLLIGGPPCQAYSLVGRARNQGISSEDHRVHLYKEYLRIIAIHHPAVFVMENVKGLLSAEINGEKVFHYIKKDLQNPNHIFPDSKSPRYKVFSFVKEPDEYDPEGFPVYKNDKDFLIKTEYFGIPQRRHRVILLGIREDIPYEKLNTLNKRSEAVSLEKVINSLPKIRSGINREIIGTDAKGKNTYESHNNDYSNWFTAVNDFRKKFEPDFYGIRLEFFNKDFQGKNYFMAELNETDNPLYNNWYKDERLNGVLNHESRTHLKEDLGRYLFSSLYLKKHGEFPRLKDYPDWLMPKHKNAKKGDKFTDRFRTQRPDQPATTVTSHISKDGHYFIHYDPSQCRSLTVREAARIQTFPDNYYFCGSRTAQFHQVGNAVPPYLAKQLAEVVYAIVKFCKQ